MRGTGRTTAQIKNLKDGGVLVVHSMHFKRYCEEIAKNLGKNITVLPVHHVIGAVSGRIIPDYDIDHFTKEETRPEVLAQISEFLSTRLGWKD